MGKTRGLQAVNEYVNFLHVYEINFYRTATGHCPVEEFLDGLAGKQVQKVTWTLQLIEELERVPSKYLEKMIGTDNNMLSRMEAVNTCVMQKTGKRPEPFLREERTYH